MDEVLEKLRSELQRERVLISISEARSQAIAEAISSLEALGESGSPAKAPREPLPKRPANAGPKRAPRPAPVKPTPRIRPHRRADGAPSHEDVAKVANASDGTARGVLDAVAKHFGISGQAAGQFVRRARERGLIPPLSVEESKPFTNEPITKMPVDEQKIRDEQAGPPVGPVKPITGRGPDWHAKPATPAPTVPKFTDEMAREAIAAAG